MKTLYSKFVLITVVIMVFSTVVGFLFANTYYHQKVKEENDYKNMEIAKEVAAFAETQEDPVAYMEQTADTGYQLYVISESGSEQFYGGEFRDKTIASNVIKQVLDGDVYHGMREFPRETFVTGFFANELSNTVGVPFENDGEQYALFMRPNIKLLFSEVHTLLGWMIAVMVVLSIISVLIGARMLVNPIKELSEATGKVGDEHFDVTLSINREDEIGKLADRFNEMTHRLGELDMMRKSFISNVSHDIQSPLLNIQGYARLLESNELTNEEKAHYTGIIQDETRRLSSLTNQLLVLSSLTGKIIYTGKSRFMWQNN